MPRLEALGVSGAPAPGRLTTTFRLSDGVFIDVGSATEALPGATWHAVQHILLTHAHLDHTMGLPFLLTAATPTIYGLEETLAATRESLLNDRVWPDLSGRATWREIARGDTIDVCGHSIRVGPADHTVPCVSYCTDGIVIVGDTRRNADVIAWAVDCAPDACIIECSYPDSYTEMAQTYGHQTPQDIPAWREALGPDVDLFLTHAKPKHDSAIRAECEALADPRLRLLRDGDTL